MRHRNDLVEMASQHVQHMHKALTQMNVEIQHVISDITGVTGLAIWSPRLREIAPTNSVESEVLALAVERDEVLLTNDVDFGDIVRYPPSDHCGVILFAKPIVGY
jgi:predicted nuclease of predicted toxin-antitoxin system